MTVYERREAFIQLLYRYFLLKKTKKQMLEEISDDFQVSNLNNEEKQHLTKLFNNIENIINVVSLKISDTWTWTRIPNVLKAVLVDGFYEIKIMEINKPIVINELMNIAHKYSPSTNNSFINAILDTL